MKNINFVLEKIRFLSEYKIKLDNLGLENLSMIDDIRLFVMNNEDCLDSENFSLMTNRLVKFIEDFNDFKNIDILIESFKREFSDIIDDYILELKSNLNLKIYFYGVDKYKFVNNSYLNYPFKVIKTKKELDRLSKNNCLDVNSYKILFTTYTNLNLSKSAFNEVINYNIIASSIYNAKDSLYKSNYNFNYLNCSLEYIEKNNVETVVVGNSYPMNGLEDKLLNKDIVKLTLSSQDLYYSYMLLRESYCKNPNLKRCLFGISYYILNHDLSRGDSKYSKDMIDYVYINLLNDPHNSKLSECKGVFGLFNANIDLLIKEVFNLDAIDRYLKYEVYLKNRSYYGKVNPRLNSTSYTLGDEEFKRGVAKKRANQHNKLLKYLSTEIEYMELLKEMVKFCRDKNIKLEFIVFPVTDYYYEYLSEEFKFKFESVLKYLKEEDLVVYDLRDKSICNIEESDFADSDHLSESGAVKISNYLKKII